MQKTWLITGCSAGLGCALAEAVAARRDRLVAAARSTAALEDLREQHPDTVQAVALDVTRPGAFRADIATDFAHEGGT